MNSDLIADLPPFLNESTAGAYASVEVPKATNSFILFIHIRSLRSTLIFCMQNHRPRKLNEYPGNDRP